MCPDVAFHEEMPKIPLKVHAEQHDGGEERIMMNLKGFKPLTAYLSRVSLRWFSFFFHNFPMGYRSFDDFPILPSGVWVYYIVAD